MILKIIRFVLLPPPKFNKCTFAAKLILLSLLAVIRINGETCATELVQNRDTQVDLDLESVIDLYQKTEILISPEELGTVLGLSPIEVIQSSESKHQLETKALKQKHVSVATDQSGHISPSSEEESQGKTRKNSGEGITITSSASVLLFQQAQIPNTNPNEDRFLQPVPKGAPLPEAEIESPLDQSQSEQPPVPEDPSSDSAPSIAVTQIDIQGNTIFEESDFNDEISVLEGKTVTLKQLQDVADKITLRYVSAGYITSKAVLVDQTIVDGIVKIQVIEGGLAEIQVEGNERLNKSYIRKRLKRGIDTPLNATKLEENLRLLSLDPLFKEVKGQLKPGNNISESILAVQVEREKAWSLTLGLDNYTVPSIAPERIGASFSYNNLTGLGDSIAASYYRGLNFGDFDRASLNQYSISYAVPLNARNGTLQLSADINDREVTDPALEDLDIEGQSEQYQISFRQPVIHTLREELALSVGFVFQDGQTLISPPFADTEDRNRVLSLGQDYLKRDSKGFWTARSQFNIGLDVFNSLPEGEFFSWSGQAQRVQNLGNDFLLILQGDLQFSPDNLPSFYEFVIGGGQSVRGYRQNSRSGDNGYQFSLEARLPILRNKKGSPMLQFAPFFDVGQVWDTRGEAIDQDFLAGIGIGLILQPISGLDFRLDYGYPIIETTQGTRSLQDEAIHFSLSYSP